MTDGLRMLVNCSYNKSSAVGMVVMVQSSAIDSVNELIVGVSTDTCNAVVLQLSRTGTHQVTVFPHMEGTGIIGRRVEYSEERNVSGEVPGEGNVSQGIDWPHASPQYSQALLPLIHIT